MDESQAELRELEPQASHIQHLIDHGSGSDSGDEMGGNVDNDDEDSEDLDDRISDVGNCLLGTPVERMSSLCLIHVVIIFRLEIGAVLCIAGVVVVRREKSVAASTRRALGYPPNTNPQSQLS